MGYVHSTLVNIAEPFSKVIIPIYTIQYVRVEVIFHHYQFLVLLWGFNLLPMTYESFRAHWPFRYFCVDLLFKTTFHFSVELSIFFKLTWSSLYILDIRCLCIVNYFSHYGEYLFLVLMLSFDEEEFSTLMRSKPKYFL